MIEAAPLNPSTPSVRQLLAPLWRRRWVLACVTLLGVIGAVGSVYVATEETYEGEMTLLVRRERVDPLITPDKEVRSSQIDISESELLSEVELLRSRDLLGQVAIDAGLVRDPGGASHDPAVAWAVNQIRRRLKVSPVRRTMMIRIVYSAPSREGAARVLDSLSRRYLDKHLAAHRPKGAHDFFADQTARARAALQQAQERLMAFGAREGVTEPTVEKDGVLRQLADFDAVLQQTRAAVADADRRLATLQTQLSQTPARAVRAVSTGSNSGLLSQLTSRILELELQRDELARRFTPQYPPLAQVEAQLSHTREALREAREAPILSETSDVNATYEWLQTEAARVRSERDALRARAAAIARTMDDYRQRAQTLEEQSHAHQELLREVKLAEDSYLLYQRKQEEARIADALDSTRITNVTVADAPSVPLAPSRRGRALVLLAGLAAALLAGLGAAYLTDWLWPSFASARDVEDVLGVPVLARARASLR